jgi:tRNA nucleotidyltransferase (CCA-adding enzyme)
MEFIKHISPDAAEAIRLLKKHGYKAYLTGGCVRDLLLGKLPADWDITTSALPEETKAVFEEEGCRTLDTGIQHGTVSVLFGREILEITTFRTESAYSDGRHPDEVTFVRSAEEDVKRRDFTMNALLLDPDEGILDYVGGRADIEAGIIRCVGNPEERFSEDALRIMRAVRFYAQLGFDMDPDTSEAVLSCREKLSTVSAERLQAELDKMMTGDHVFEAMMEYREVLAVYIPELKAMFGYPQHNPHHQYDVWEHTAVAVKNILPEKILRLTMLLHDSGKPHCGRIRGDGYQCFTGHPHISATFARQALKRLKYPANTVETVAKLIMQHDEVLGYTSPEVRRMMNRLGKEDYRRLLLIRRADVMAQSEYRREEKLALLDQQTTLYKEIASRNLPYQIRDLKVNGKDLIGAGVPEGPAVGQILQKLLDAVMDEEVPNEKNALLDKARSLI